MVKKSLIQRQIKRINLNNIYKKIRDNLIINLKKTNNFDLKQEIHNKIQKLPRDSSKIRLRNSCWKTGRFRGYYSDFGLSRHVFREMAHEGLLPGLKKSSW
jgi:small subunit ribosomal protein S14